MSTDAPPSAPTDDGARPWLAPVLFFTCVALVIGVASAVATRHRALRGADFFTGRYVDARFAAPPSLVGAPAVVHDFAWPLRQGSGSLRVRFETTARAGSGAVVSAVRVERGADLLDGLEATVRVTGYDTRAVIDGVEAPWGRVSLECVERASDGEATHRVELRGDGRHVDPDAR